MSDPTPDGDLFSDAGVAIRTFISRNPNGLSDAERAQMRAWAEGCRDPANQKRLLRLMDGLTSRP